MAEQTDTHWLQGHWDSRVENMFEAPALEITNILFVLLKL